MDGFVKASELSSPGLSQEEEHQAQLDYLYSIIALKDKAIESRPEQSSPMKPEDKQALVIVIDELQTGLTLCKQTIVKQDQTIEKQGIRLNDLEKENKELGKEVYELREMAVLMIKDACKRITTIEEKAKAQQTSPGKTDTQRVQKLVRYMNARADHKASFETLRGYFQIKTNQLTALIRAADKLDPGRFIIKADPRDRRKRWLMAKK